MLTLTEIFAIIIIHWIADFVLQTDKQAKGKSKNWDDLLSHVLSYSSVWGVFIPLYFRVIEGVDIITALQFGYIFSTITFIAHTTTDYFTSRLNSKLWAAGKVHEFFVSIGFDQILHYVQLFLTYYLLKSL